MKVKFIQDYMNYHRGMQYPIEQIGEETAKRLESEGIARIFPLPTVEPEAKPVAKSVVKPAVEPVKVAEVKTKKKGKK